MEKPDNLRRAKRLPLLLSALAQEIYDVANELERTGTLILNLGDFGARTIADRIAFHGYAFEVQHRFVPLEFLDDLPAHLVATPLALRRWAHTLKNNADRAQRLVTLYEESVEMLRGLTKGGRFPSVSMYWLIRTTDEWRSTIPEIARQLIQRGVLPTSESDDPDPQHQWEMLLKKGRMRARRRIAA